MKKIIIILMIITMTLILSYNVKADELYKGAYYMGHIPGWSTSFNSYNNAGLLTSYTYDDSITYPNTFNENNVSKITIDGYFYNLQGVSGTNDITCNDNSLGYCTKWNINNGYTISFKLWITDEAYPCQISFDTMPNSENADYIFWTATCPYDLDFNRVKYHIYVYGMNSGGVGFGINENIHYYVTEGQAIINNQNQNTQQIINNQTNQTQEIINQNATYEDTPSQEINGTSVENYEQAESQLLDRLNLNTTVMDNITINPQASLFIWNIVERLRGMNGAIVLLMTSILGIGIMKLVLNR